MSTDLVVAEPIELGEGWKRGSADRVSAFVSEGAEMRAMARAIAQGGAYKHQNESVVLTIMLAAYEMDIPVTKALQGMYPVRGKLEMEGWLMDGLAISRCGIRKTVVDSTDRKCKITFHRDNWSDMTVEYDLRHAEKMGIIRDLDMDAGTFKTSKDPWKRSTEEMLYWRCLSKGLKRIAPDYFGGIYAVGELRGVSEHQGTASAKEDMDRLRGGVDPDPDEMTEDEIDALRSACALAVRDGRTSEDAAGRIMDSAIAGEWAEARAGWAIVTAPGDDE